MDPNDYGRADLHIHTVVSDGLADVQSVLNHVAQRGDLDVIAITDHDRLSASLWAYQRRDDYPFDIVPGVEVTTNAGHVLALWVTRPITPMMSLTDTVSAIHDQGGVAILAHPFHVQLRVVAMQAWRMTRNRALLDSYGFDALEAHNAGVIVPFTNIAARWFARRTGYPVVGCSDAHTPGAIGSGYTLFPGRTADNLRNALINGQTIACGSPWPLAEYRRFVRDLIARRGRICHAPEPLSPDALHSQNGELADIVTGSPVHTSGD